MNQYGIPQYLSYSQQRSQKLTFSKQLVALWPVFALILPAQLALNSPWQLAVFAGIGLFVAGGFLISTSVPKGIYQQLPLMLLFAMVTASIVSAALNKWVHPILVYSANLLAYYAALRVVVFVKNPVAFVKSVVMGSTFVAFVLIVACVAVERPTIYRYEGIFNNPNSLGWFTAGMISLYLGIYVYSRTTWTKMQRLVIFGVLFLCIFLLFASNSRAGLAGLCASIGSFGLVFFHSLAIRSRLRRGRIIAGIILLVILCGVAYQLGLLDRVIEKFVVTSDRGDFSQGRVVIWQDAIPDLEWFGSGTNAIVRAHSTYLSHLSKYGIIPTILFTSFYLVLWIYGYLYTLRGDCISAPILLSTSSAFLAHAMLETGSATPGVWFSMLMFCCLSEEIWRRKVGRQEFHQIQHQMANHHQNRTSIPVGQR